MEVQVPCSPTGPAERIRLWLPPEPTSPGVARNLVADACHAWQLLPMLYPGRAVVSELVANAVEHGGTHFDVSVSCQSGALHLAVRDGSRTMPRLLDLAAPAAGRPLNERGHGLRVVEADSIAWGAIPVANGKVVWALIRARDNYSRRW